MSQTNTSHRYEIWWVDRAGGPDVRSSGESSFDDYHLAQQELLCLDKPLSGHYVIQRFELNSPAGEIVHVDRRWTEASS